MTLQNPQPQTEEQTQSPASAQVIDFSSHVFPPYHGEATHPDPRRLIVPITAVYRDPENARLHPERNIRQVRASLRRDARGQQTPINVDRTGKILKGNGTHESAELEGWQYIWIVVSGLEGPEALAYENSDNATGLSSAWDFQQLSSDVQSLKEFDGTELEFTNDDLGFEEHELGPLQAANWSPGTFTGEGNGEVQPSGNNPLDNPQDPGSQLEAGDNAANCAPVIVTPNQRLTIERAIATLRETESEPEMSEGRALELICAAYLS
jgi:hypothetical protein